jgi:hypothetical protein
MIMRKLSSSSYRNYNTGHPWYYHLGGPVLKPKQILETTRYSGYKGYRSDNLIKMNDKIEPERSNHLRKTRVEMVVHLQADLHRYRQCALELKRYRDRKGDFTDTPPSCDDVHTNISFKHNHLVNGFAHLITIDELLSKQGDLFGI